MNYMSIGGFEYSDYQLSNTHGKSGGGGHDNSALHKKEIEHICNDIIDKKIHDYDQYINDYIKEEIRNIGDYIANNIYAALNKDVITTVDVVGNDGRTLWNDSKTKELFYREIYNVFRDGLNNKTFNIK